MSQIDEKLTDLIEAIRGSSEFYRYQEAKNRLHENPELEKTVHDFRKKNYHIQNSGNVNLFEEVDKLERENASIRSNSIVEEYMTAEIAFCRVIQNINWTLIDGLDFEVGFVNEG